MAIGYSFVDLAVDVETGQKFALKRIKCHDKCAERAASKEIDFYKMFNHPNLISIIDSSVIRPMSVGKPVEILMLLPLLTGGNLYDIINKASTTKSYFSEDYIFRIFYDVCLAVQHLHKSRAIPYAHRDIKPGNILIDENDNPMLMDFGSMEAARIEIKTHMDAMKMEDTAAQKCTIAYRAPELFNISSDVCGIDEKIDVWSLGCLLYSMAFLQSPFEFQVNERGGSLSLAIVSGKYEIPPNPSYSDHLLNLIKFLLVVNPNDRPEINEVVEKLSEISALAANAV
ncbi:uncharacterized protein TRIADDRAFT_54919 [Trichoplax adhaerens]|uniref:non-specific serine/threonine protein kinase n=1 Tax=Trichoplax adhaerens TaxID=10228 RepID=B3RTD0_TRIAD|nr:hypothetical protein TRIADDRAFT_54919 [Trichoplax adhaerens]EDV27204.1 hypothetical protein TRIADDRAFT_54919 [Trichoplax adhaerens]|eukprot:XP_002111200.1 hypothetical protein TRIADDRAFT_54919 [Trichoplax adhaerens]